MTKPLGIRVVFHDLHELVDCLLKGECKYFRIKPFQKWASGILPVFLLPAVVGFNIDACYLHQC